MPEPEMVSVQFSVIAAYEAVATARVIVSCRQKRSMSHLHLFSQANT